MLSGLVALVECGSDDWDAVGEMLPLAGSFTSRLETSGLVEARSLLGADALVL